MCRFLLMARRMWKVTWQTLDNQAPRKIPFYIKSCSCFLKNWEYTLFPWSSWPWSKGRADKIKLTKRGLSKRFLKLECAYCTNLIQTLFHADFRKSPKYSKEGSYILLARVWSSQMGLVSFSLLHICEHHRLSISENQTFCSLKSGRKLLANLACDFLSNIAESVGEDRRNFLVCI